jgi:hypothetical protein
MALAEDLEDELGGAVGQFQIPQFVKDDELDETEQRRYDF